MTDTAACWGNEHGTIREELEKDFSDWMGPALGIIHRGHAARLRNGKLEFIPVNGAKSPQVYPHLAQAKRKLADSCRENDYLCSSASAEGTDIQSTYAQCY